MSKDESKATSYALISSLAASVSPLTSKMALAQLTTITLSCCTFGAAAVFSLVDLLLKGRLKDMRSLRRFALPILIISLLDTLGAFLLGNAYLKSDPGTVMFAHRSSIIFALILGFLFLREKINRLEEVLAYTLVVIGIGALSLKPNFGLDGGVILAIASALAFSASSVVLKKSASLGLNPLLANGARNVFTAAIFAGWGLARHQLSLPSPTLLAIITLGAFLSTFLANNLYSTSLMTLNLSTAYAISSLRPVFVTIFSLILFQTTPTPVQITGAAITLTGIILLSKNLKPQPVS